MKRYLALPGALLLIAAFIRSAVEVQWDSTSIGLAAAGAVIVAITVIWNWQEVVEWLRDPRGVFAVMTGITVAVFIAVLVMVNIAVWYNPWSVDLTASGRNQVSEETSRVLRRLEEPVSLRQFGRSAESRVDQLLRAFERESRQVRVEYVDPEQSPQLAREYGVIRNGTVVVVSGDNHRKLDEPNEAALVTAILQVTTDEERVVCFVTGHGERGLADQGAGGLGLLAATLEASNYRAERVSLLAGDVPGHCRALIIAGARQPLEPVELERLTASGDTVRRIAILLEPDPAPSFAEFLRPRGIDPVPGIIIDTSGAGRTVGGGPQAPLALAYQDHPVTRGFEIATMYDGARPLQVIERPEYGGKPTAIAQTGPRSFATTAIGAEAVPAFVETRDTPGPLTLAAATTMGGSAKPEEQVRLAVFGDSDFISNAFLRRQGNRDFFLRTLAWLLGEQEAVIVSVDDRENRRIDLTERTKAWMYIVNLGLLPLIPFTAGVIVLLRSRR